MGTATTETFPENKWTMRDKLIQLRNVTKLQDRATVEEQFTASEKHKIQANKIKKLTKNNKNLRKILEINIRGDASQRRTTLRKNRAYQLAYQHKPTEKIVEKLSEVIFDKVNKLNKLRYEKQVTEDTLRSLKNQLMVSKEGNTIFEKLLTEQELLNKLQNMKEKQKAAVIVKKTYENVIKILRDDARTFDDILDNLKFDRILQSRCILNATEMGQKASEDLGNLHEAYKAEEVNILTVMRKMDLTAKSIKSELDRIIHSCRTVVRSESLTRFTSFVPGDDESMYYEFVKANIRQRELAGLQESLQKLKEVSEVLEFDEIYPRIRLQVHQQINLLNQRHIRSTLRDNLLDQRNQLESLFEHFKHTMVSTTEWYKEEKARLKSETDYLDKECSKIKKAIQENGELLLKIRLALLSLSRKLDRIDTLSNFRVLKDDLEDSSPEGVSATIPPPETDSLEILDKIHKKLQMLFSKVKNTEIVLSYDYYAQSKRDLELELIKKNIIEHKEDSYELAMTEMLEELGATVDPSVPTRLAIKRQSFKIVEILGREHPELFAKQKSHTYKVARRRRR